MKVCIIRPSIVAIRNSVTCEVALPTGVAYLAAYLRREGFQISMIDAMGEGLNTLSPIDGVPGARLLGLSDTDTVARIPPDTDVIGVSCMYSVNWVANRRLLQAIRARFPGVPLIIGGEHATALPEYSLRDAGVVDVLVLGEGEATTAQVLKAMASGTDIREVPGIAFLRDDEYCTSGPRARLRDVDDLPWPAWDLVPVENYLGCGSGHCLDSGRSISILTSRGCPYECTFCSNPVMWGRLWRPRAVDDIVAEMEHYIRTYKVDHIDLLDLTTIVNRSWIIRLCERMIDRGVKVSWQIVNSRTEALDAEVCRLLKQAGCTYVTFAVESGSVDRLAATKKRLDAEAVLTSIPVAVSSGLGVKLSFMTGFPDDRLSDFLASYWMSIRAAWRGAHDASFFPFMPYPGSELFEQMVASGRIRLGDAFFFDLLVLEYGFMRSWSRRFGDYQLRFLSLFGWGLFYLAVFVFRPSRFVRFVSDLARSEGTTKLAAGLIRLRRQRRDVARQPAAG